MANMESPVAGTCLPLLSLLCDGGVEAAVQWNLYLKVGKVCIEKTQ